jgi:DNA-binding CsgD family transcriptional regulator
VVLVLLALLGGAGFVALEVAADGEAVSAAEVLLDSIEKALVFVGAGGVFFLLDRTRRQHRQQLELLEELDVARSEGAGWRRRAHAHMAGLGSEIDRQFGQWGLTEAEREVGLLLLKGLSHKEVASLRGTAEATVRQQARSIYQKSGLPGKTAFSAFFLEDLLPGEGLRYSPDRTAISDAAARPPAGDGRAVMASASWSEAAASTRPREVTRQE